MNNVHIDELAERLHRLHRNNRSPLPNKRHAEQFLDETLELIFPHLIGESELTNILDIRRRIEMGEAAIVASLSSIAATTRMTPGHIADEFFHYHLPRLVDDLWLDAEAIYQGDPAAKSVEEVVATYPGMLATAVYRIAHAFVSMDLQVFPRMLTEIGHQRTGVDIHPNAIIGKSFCIDHATGIVIGETAVLGDYVKLYQGVTLGALSVTKEMAKTKRHPTIEDHVVIYANATILGGETAVGHHSIIGGNVWLTESVPPFSSVYHRANVQVKQRAGHSPEDALLRWFPSI